MLGPTLDEIIRPGPPPTSQFRRALAHPQGARPLRQSFSRLWVESGLGVRHVSVAEGDLREGYRDMEDFIDIVADARLAELLSGAINGRGAFRRFGDVLARFPEERERWFQFQNARLRQRALEWLEEVDIESE